MGKGANNVTLPKTYVRRPQIPNWLKALLLIFALCTAGLAISIAIGSFIPLWLLLGFSLLYSIEKWFYYLTGRHKALGKLYRLLLNLSILSLLGLIVWSGIKLFSQQLGQSALVGSLMLLVEFALFIWMWRVVAKNSWRQPSMKLTIFCFICLFLVFSFAGVSPLSTYKDTLITKWGDYQAEQELEQQKLISVDGFAVLFNEHRQSYGLSVLTFTDDLNKRASLRLSELELDYSHNSLGNYNLHLAENINWASYTLDNNEVFLSWKASPGHNANMLNASYKYTGYAIGGGYAVQLFSEYPTVNGEPQLPSGWHWDD